MMLGGTVVRGSAAHVGRQYAYVLEARGSWSLGLRQDGDRFSLRHRRQAAHAKGAGLKCRTRHPLPCCKAAEGDPLVQGQTSGQEGKPDEGNWEGQQDNDSSIQERVWVTCNDGVYDVTELVEHPERLLLAAVGRGSSDAALSLTPSQVPYKVGTLKGSPRTGLKIIDLQAIQPPQLEEPAANAPPQVPSGSEAIAEALEAEAEVRKEVLAVAVTELQKAYTQDLRYTARNILVFRQVGDTFEWLSLVLSALGSIAAYMAGVMDGDKWWAFAAGATGSVALAIAAIGRYCNSQSKERTQQLNKLLSRYGLPTYPDVVVSFEAGDLEAMASGSSGKPASPAK